MAGTYVKIQNFFSACRFVNGFVWCIKSLPYDSFAILVLATLAKLRSVSPLALILIRDLRTTACWPYRPNPAYKDIFSIMKKCYWYKHLLIW